MYNKKTVLLQWMTYNPNFNKLILVSWTIRNQLKISDRETGLQKCGWHSVFSCLWLVFKFTDYKAVEKNVLEWIKIKQKNG